MNTLTRNKRLALGLCVECGERPPIEPRQTCEACAYKIGMVNKTRYEKRLAANICIRCGKYPSLPNCCHCEKCFDKSTAEEAGRNKENVKARVRKHRQILKTEVVNHYGGKCECCGEIELTFLTIDHKNGGGSEHRRQLGIGGGMVFYRWVKRNNYPDYLRVLCWNCNSATSHGRVCPHQLTSDQKQTASYVLSSLV